ncbi:MAG: hypothetical protein SF097_14615 [Acidobacteriota bacterium]|nr:hypothetical protein [Acidobacteriota bacterium]
MPIPQFNHYGLLPTGIHECTLAEIEANFIYNGERKLIWNDFLRYFEQIREHSEILTLYFDGSFVTNRERPGDLDLVIEFEDLYQWGRLSREAPDLFDSNKIKQEYNLDILPCARVMMSWQEDYRSLFQKLKLQDVVKLGTPEGFTKGILLVNLRGTE